MEHGYKTGDRYSDGTEWGEHWCRVYEPAVWEGEAQKKTEELEGPAGVDGTVLRIRHHDKWWKETTGNKWGEKRCGL